MKRKIMLFGIITAMSLASMGAGLNKVDHTLTVKEDTYISTDAESANYGSEALMKPKMTKTFNRMSIMKFDILENEVEEMKAGQLKIAITFGSGAEEAEYSVYAFNNLKWNEKDATYEKLKENISLDKGSKVGEIQFKKADGNDAKYYSINVTEALKNQKKGEITFMLVDEKEGNKNLNVRTKEHSEKWAPKIEIEKK